MRSKERLWNRTFLTAFGIALGLHLFGLLFFRIAPMTFRWEQTVSSPTTVYAEFVQDGIALATVDQEELPARYLPAPPTTPLAFPSFPKNLPLHTIDPSTISFNDAPFKDMEAALWNTAAERPVLPHIPPLQVRIIGPLAFRLQEDLPVWHPPSMRTLKGAYRILISIKVEERSGTIFWQDLRESSGIPLLDNEAFALLKKMRFVPQAGPLFVADGIIEMTFTLGET